MAVPEEIPFDNGWIDREELHAMGSALAKNGDGQYLLRLAREAGVGSQY